MKENIPLDKRGNGYEGRSVDYRLLCLCYMKFATSFVLVSRLAYSSILNMEATCSFETSIDIQRNIRCYISYPPLTEPQILQILQLILH
jgi:hypothetical protein